MAKKQISDSYTTGGVAGGAIGSFAKKNEEHRGG